MIPTPEQLEVDEMRESCIQGAVNKLRSAVVTRMRAGHNWVSASGESAAALSIIRKELTEAGWKLTEGPYVDSIQWYHEGLKKEVPSKVETQVQQERWKEDADHAKLDAQRQDHESWGP